MNFFRKRKKKYDFDLSPGEALFDAKNVSGLEQEKMEGVFEKPLEEKNLYYPFYFFLFLVLIFSYKAFSLQVLKYDDFLEKSLNNFIREEVLFLQRGVVYDRNGTELIWNNTDLEKDFSARAYIKKEGFSHLLGFLAYPQKDEKGIYYSREYEGKGGIEKSFNKQLNGVLGKKIIEIDAFGETISQNTIVLPEKGESLVLSIDEKIQEKLFQFLEDFSKEKDFQAGAGMIMSLENGEILSAVSYPEYSSEVLTSGKNREKIEEYITDPREPFLNRFSFAEFTPGSIMKIFVAMGALEEGLINPNDKIFTNGELVIENPYNPELPTIFRDWKNHGSVNMYDAIANSSNVYFYILGGGFSDISGLGIEKLDIFYRDFGFGKITNLEGFSEKEGVVPNRVWKREVFNEGWGIADTYFTSIGQFGTLVTPVQALVATGAIATEGKVFSPKILKQKEGEENISEILDFSKNNFQIVKEGMRQTVLRGTTQSLNFSFLKVAAKSGTAEVGKNREKVNSWAVGFFPYENPKYAFVVMAEDGPPENNLAVSVVMSNLLKWMNENELSFYWK